MIRGRHTSRFVDLLRHAHEPAIDSKAAGEARLRRRERESLQGHFDLLDAAIDRRASAQFELQKHAASKYSYGHGDTKVTVGVVVGQGRSPPLTDPRPLQLYQDLGLPNHWPLEPPPDESSGSDSDDDQRADDEIKIAERVRAADKKRVVADEAAAAGAAAAHLHVRRVVADGGRYNYTGTPRGTLYRDRRLPKSCRTGFGFEVLGGLLRYDRHPFRKPGTPAATAGPSCLSSSIGSLRDHS
jgi:hypothetical protein